MTCEDYVGSPLKATLSHQRVDEINLHTRERQVDDNDITCLRQSSVEINHDAVCA